MAINSALENFTVVIANKQLKGRGQQNKNWESEPYKNLTISVFVNDFNLKINEQKYLNFAVSLSIFDVLKNNKIPNIFIKWPNDIMAVNKKVCGILIENTFKGNKIKNSIIGIGLNVNQEQFPKFIKNVSSLKNLTHKEFNIDVLLTEIVNSLKERIQFLSDRKFSDLENEYLDVLYKKNIATMFKDSNDVLFMGVIKGISSDGNLLIELEDETIKEFGLKEVSLA